MRKQRRINHLVVLTPVLPGRVDEFAACVAGLRSDADRPFRNIARTHFARFVLVGPANARPGAPAGSLGMTYLLFTSTFDGPVGDYLDDLIRQLGEVADAIWGGCAGYPQGAGRTAVRRYLEDNSLGVHMRFDAHSASVDEVRAALRLRRAHAEIAREASLRDPVALHRSFCERFK